MFKRQFWKHDHGDSSGSSSDDDSSNSDTQDTGSSGQEDAGSSESEAHSSQQAEGSSEGEGSDGGSQDDEGSSQEGSDDVEAEQLTAEHVIKVWASNDPEAQKFKGLPLRCLACNVLLLNRASYLNHMESKKHKQKVVGRGGSRAVVVLASEADQEEAETHTERLERLQREVALLTAEKKEAEAKAAGKAAGHGTSKPSKAAPSTGNKQATGGEAKPVAAPNKGGVPVAKENKTAAAVASKPASKAGQTGPGAGVAVDGKGNKKSKPGKRERAEMKAKADAEGKPKKRAKAGQPGAESVQDPNHQNSKTRRLAARAAARQQAATS